MISKEESNTGNTDIVLSDKEDKKPEVTDQKKLPTWHSQQELILKKWSEIGSSYRYLHDKSFSKYNTQNLRFALPVIIISTITGTANFAQSSFPTAWVSYVPLAIGFLNLTAGLITTIAQFLRVSELLEGHRSASIAYSKFSRNISVELSLPIDQRTSDGFDFVVLCRQELDRLIEQSPNIPNTIVKLFASRFKDSAFFKPDILDIRPVDIYKNDIDEELRERNRILDEEKSRRDVILQEEERRRMVILQDIQAERAQQDAELLKKIELIKQDRKDKIDISAVEDNLDKLLSKLKNTKLPSIDSSSDSRSKLSIIINDLINPTSSKKRVENIIEESLSTSSNDTESCSSKQSISLNNDIILSVHEPDSNNIINDTSINSEHNKDTSDSIKQSDTVVKPVNKSVLEEKTITLSETQKALLKKQKIDNKFYYIDVKTKNVFNTKYVYVGTLTDDNKIKFK